MDGAIAVSQTERSNNWPENAYLFMRDDFECNGIRCVHLNSKVECLLREFDTDWFNIILVRQKEY